MSQELLYTSAPTGLKSGSRGFATVLCTAGMASNITSRLETLSGYRHVFAPQDPQASLNPVSWSHLRLTINGQPTSILSRVAAYGVDYSGRTNKLAHHVVPSPTEMAQAGPAWLMLQSSWVRTDWDGSCQMPPSGPVLPSGNQPVAICQRWQQVTGDAGWGGVLAETIASPTAKPLWIVFSIDQSAGLLSLINESIALLPVSQRWRATFSTYYTNLPPEIDCKIRCVLVGTEEAKLAPARGVVIDLTKNLTPAAESAYVETARTGFVAAQPIAPMPENLGGHTSSSNSSPLEVIDGGPLWPDELSLQPPAVLGKPPALALPNKPNLPPQLPSKAFNGGVDEATKRRIGWAIGISVLAIILLLSAAIPVILKMKKHSDGITELAANNRGRVDSTEEKERPHAAIRDGRFMLLEQTSENQTAGNDGAGAIEETTGTATEQAEPEEAGARESAAAETASTDAAATAETASTDAVTMEAATVKVVATEGPAMETANTEASAMEATDKDAAANQVAEKASTDRELEGWLDIKKFIDSESVEISFSRSISLRVAESYTWTMNGTPKSEERKAFDGKSIDQPVVRNVTLKLTFNHAAEIMNGRLIIAQSRANKEPMEIIALLNIIRDAYKSISSDQSSLSEKTKNDTQIVIPAMTTTNFMSSFAELDQICSKVISDYERRIEELNIKKAPANTEEEIKMLAENIKNIINAKLRPALADVESMNSMNIGVFDFYAPRKGTNGALDKLSDAFEVVPVILKLKIKE